MAIRRVTLDPADAYRDCRPNRGRRPAGPTAGSVERRGARRVRSLEAARAQTLINQQLGGGRATGATFLLIFASRDRAVSDAGFRAAVESALAPIQQDPRVTGVHTPYGASTPAGAQALTSKDGHEALVQVDLRSRGSQAVADYAALRREVHAADLAVTGTGNVPLNAAFNTTLESDLRRAGLADFGRPAAEEAA